MKIKNLIEKIFGKRKNVHSKLSTSIYIMGLINITLKLLNAVIFYMIYSIPHWANLYLRFGYSILCYFILDLFITSRLFGDVLRVYRGIQGKTDIIEVDIEETNDK